MPRRRYNDDPALIEIAIDMIRTPHSTFRERCRRAMKRVHVDQENSKIESIFDRLKEKFDERPDYWMRHGHAEIQKHRHQVMLRAAKIASDNLKPQIEQFRRIAEDCAPALRAMETWNAQNWPAIQSIIQQQQNLRTIGQSFRKMAKF